MFHCVKLACCLRLREATVVLAAVKRCSTCLPQPADVGSETAVIRFNLLRLYDNELANFSSSSSWR